MEKNKDELTFKPDLSKSQAKKTPKQQPVLLCLDVSLGNRVQTRLMIHKDANHKAVVG
jgi:hypothetical protein